MLVSGPVGILTCSSLRLRLKCIYGIAYDCSICQNFLVCRKCYGRIDIYLGDRPVPGPDAHVHKFQLWDSDEPEFQKTWPTSPSDVNEWSSQGLDNHAGSDANDLILEDPPGSVGSSTASGSKNHDDRW